MHHLNSWIKRDQLDVTCFFISLFTAQHVSDVNTSILRSLRLVCRVISCVVLLWFDGCWCYGVVWLGWCGILMQSVLLCFVVLQRNTQCTFVAGHSSQHNITQHGMLPQHPNCCILLVSYFAHDARSQEPKVFQLYVRCSTFVYRHSWRKIWNMW